MLQLLTDNGIRVDPETFVVTADCGKPAGANTAPHHAVMGCAADRDCADGPFSACLEASDLRLVSRGVTMFLSCRIVSATTSSTTKPATAEIPADEPNIAAAP